MITLEQIAIKASKLVVDKKSESVLITQVQEMPLKDGFQPALKIRVLSADGKTFETVVSKAKHEGLKTGPAYINMTEWSKDSKFGIGVSKSIVNVGV